MKEVLRTHAIQISIMSIVLMLFVSSAIDIIAVNTQRDLSISFSGLIQVAVRSAEFFYFVFHRDFAFTNITLV